MRVLLVLPRFPYPPERGDTLRSWATVSALGQKHEVWLACLNAVRPAPAQLERVRSRCAAVAVCVCPARTALRRGIIALLRGQSVTEGYFYDRRLELILRRWSRTVAFDALLTYSSAMGWVAEIIEARRRVLDLGDVDSAKWALYASRCGPPLGWLYGCEARRVAALEERVTRHHDLCLVVNERERAKLHRRLPELTTAVYPTTVARSELVAVADMRLPSQPVVGMLGSMFYPPNVRAVNWFGRYVWPAVRREVPQARWLIVGQRPHRQVRRWARTPGVTVTGYVANVRPRLLSMRVFVNAVDNDLGVQSKLIVAMAAGRPCVVTPACAAGLDVGDPPPFLVADTPAVFAEAVVRLLRDDAQARELARRARALVDERYCLEDQVARLEKWLAGPLVTAPRVRAQTEVIGA